jgi:superfamily II RNA helicase
MEILVLIDKLDDALHNARPVPLTDQVRVDKEEIFDILDQMRASIPEEMKQARYILEREKTRGGDAGSSESIDHQALTQAVSAAIKENIPEIARATAAAAAGAHGGSAPSPPGGPF